MIVLLEGRCCGEARRYGRNGSGRSTGRVGANDKAPVRCAFPGSSPHNRDHREICQVSAGLSSPSRFGLPPQLAARATAPPFAGPSLRRQRLSRSDQEGDAARRLNRRHTALGGDAPFQGGFSRALLAACPPFHPLALASHPSNGVAAQTKPEEGTNSWPMTSAYSAFPP